MTDRNRSPLAAQVEDLVRDKPRAGPAFGLCVHTSGRGIVARARRRREEVLEHVIAYYQAEKFSAHYIGGWDGTLVQVTAEDRRVPHIGVEDWQRDLYLSGRWRTDARLARAAVARWISVWSPKSPQHLFPSKAANDDYVGIELPPLERPRGDGLWYTDEQHELVARLSDDLRRRHGWPAWPPVLPCPRLLGHEDLDAYDRWDAGGGWDPGALRAVPRFSWRAVRGLLP